MSSSRVCLSRRTTEEAQASPDPAIREARRADYCPHQHGEAIDIPDHGIEIVRTFVSVDREFGAWQRNGHDGVPTATGDDREGQEGLRRGASGSPDSLSKIKDYDGARATPRQLARSRPLR